MCNQRTFKCAAARFCLTFLVFGGGGAVLHRMKKLLKPSDTQTYAELTATFAEGEDIVAPPIRYHFGKKAKSNSKPAA